MRSKKKFVQLLIILNTYLFQHLWFASISVFTFLIGISVSIESSAIGLKICVITAGIKKYKSIIKKKT